MGTINQSYRAFQIVHTTVRVDKDGVFVNDVKLPNVRSVDFSMQPDSIAVVNIQLYPSSIEIKDAQVDVQEDTDKPPEPPDMVTINNCWPHI